MKVKGIKIALVCGALTLSLGASTSYAVKTKPTMPKPKIATQPIHTNTRHNPSGGLFNGLRGNLIAHWHTRTGENCTVRLTNETVQQLKSTKPSDQNGRMNLRHTFFDCNQLSNYR